MPSEALAQEGRQMQYVYMLQSESEPDQRYVGSTPDLKRYLKSGSGHAFANKRFW